MPKIYLIHQIVAEMLKRYPMTDKDIETGKNEMLYKETSELKAFLEKIKKQNNDSK